MCGLKLLLLKKKLGVEDSFLNCVVLCWEWGIGKSVSQHFYFNVDFIFFLALCVGVTRLVSRLLSEKIVACVIVYLVCFVLFLTVKAAKP